MLILFLQTSGPFDMRGMLPINLTAFILIISQFLKINQKPTLCSLISLSVSLSLLPLFPFPFSLCPC